MAFGHGSARRVSFAGLEVDFFWPRPVSALQGMEYGVVTTIEKENGGRTIWVQVFSVETWQEFLVAGGRVTGFSQARRPVVKRMKPGDFVLCYLSKIGAWIGVLEVISLPYQKEEP